MPWRNRNNIQSSVFRSPAGGRVKGKPRWLEGEEMPKIELGLVVSTRHSRCSYREKKLCRLRVTRERLEDRWWAS
jgi:hypothetical protein